MMCQILGEPWEFSPGIGGWRGRVCAFSALAQYRGVPVLMLATEMCRDDGIRGKHIKYHERLTRLGVKKAFYSK